MTGGLSIEGLSEDNFGDFIHLVEKLAEYEKLDPPDVAARGRLLADGTGDVPLFHAFVGRVEGRLWATAYTSQLIPASWPAP